MKIGRMAAWMAVIVAGCQAYRAAAADMKAVLPENEMSQQTLKAYFEQAAMTAEIDSDGDLKITENGFKGFLRVDAERKIVTIFALYGMKAAAPEIQKLQLVNRLNDKIILVRFCMPKPTTLWCDYQLRYEGGLTPYYIINTYRMFSRVTRQAVAQQDTDDVVGSD